MERYGYGMKIKESIVTEKMSDGNFMIFDSDNGNFLITNEIGKFIIDSLIENNEKNMIIQNIFSIYEVDVDAIENDYEYFLNLLAEYGLCE